MNTPIWVSIIGAIVSLAGIFLNHYLAIRRELRFHPEKQPAVREEEVADRGPRISGAISRKTLVRDRRRALLAIMVCPLVGLLVFSVLYELRPPRPHTLSIRSVVQNTEWIVLGMGPWVYAACTIVLFPLQIRFYRRVGGKGARLIFTTASWATVSVLGLFAAGGPIVILVSGGISGAISGVVYWLLTYTSFRERNTLAVDPNAPVRAKSS